MRPKLFEPDLLRPSLCRQYRQPEQPDTGNKDRQHRAAQNDLFPPRLNRILSRFSWSLKNTKWAARKQSPERLLDMSQGSSRWSRLDLNIHHTVVVCRPHREFRIDSLGEAFEHDSPSPRRPLYTFPAHHDHLLPDRLLPTRLFTKLSFTITDSQSPRIQREKFLPSITGICSIGRNASSTVTAANPISSRHLSSRGKRKPPILRRNANDIRVFLHLIPQHPDLPCGQPQFLHQH